MTNCIWRHCRTLPALFGCDAISDGDEANAAELPQLHVLLGQCYQAQKRTTEAKAEFQAAITADPAAAQPLFAGESLPRVGTTLRQSAMNWHNMSNCQKSKKRRRRPARPRM